MNLSISIGDNKNIFDKIIEFFDKNKIDYNIAYEGCINVNLTFEDLTNYLNKINISWIFKEYKDDLNCDDRYYKIISSNQDQLIFNSNTDENYSSKTSIKKLYDILNSNSISKYYLFSKEFINFSQNFDLIIYHLI